MLIGGVIWPDSETQRSVNEIRRRYDPHVELIAPHVTVIFPTDTAMGIEEISARLADAARTVLPFDVCLGRVSSVNMLAAKWPVETSALLAYPNAVNAVFLLAVEGSQEIIELKRKLSMSISLDTPLVRYPPYLTLGQTLSAEKYEKALEDLADYDPDYRFLVEGFDLLAEPVDGRWSVARRFDFSP